MAAIAPTRTKRVQISSSFFLVSQNQVSGLPGDFKFINVTKRKSVASALKGKGAIGLEFLADTYAPHAPESPA